MSKKTVYECDRCRTTQRSPGAVMTLDDKRVDLCKACSKALQSWMSRDNTTQPGDRVGWRQVCPHHVPCAGPCNSGMWEKV